SSNHFPLMPYSVKLNPVALPPGRARLSTKPPPTGSPTFTNTIGTARVASSKGGKLALPVARMTSGASAISSAAYLLTSSVLAGQRVVAHMMAFDPAQFLQPAQERRDAGSAFRIVRGG